MGVAKKGSHPARMAEPPGGFSRSLKKPAWLERATAVELEDLGLSHVSPGRAL